ncbi:hypothetical protein ACPC54_11095 [Kitasatospora sp. NPDC094028]
MRHVVGWVVFATGWIGLGVATKCVRGWENWSRRQRIAAAVFAALILAGLIVKE